MGGGKDPGFKQFFNDGGLDVQKVVGINGIFEMIKSDKDQVVVQNRASILAFFMAKDDNMILLMSGLIHSI